MKPLTIGVVCASLALVALACDPVQQGELAVKSHGQYVLAQLSPCEQFGDYRVTEITLEGTSTEPLWQARSETPKDVRSFVIGVTPAGFTESVSLSTALDPDQLYFLTARNPNGQFLQNGFHPRELHADKWLSWKNDYLSDGQVYKPMRC